MERTYTDDTHIRLRNETYNRIIAERDNAQQQVVTLEHELRNAQANPANTDQALTDYKKFVSDWLIEEAGRRGWCRDTTNNVLRTLGVPEWTDRTYRVPVTITVNVECTATDAGTARRNAVTFARIQWREGNVDNYMENHHVQFRDFRSSAAEATVNS